MLPEELSKTIVDITLDWKRFYVAFRNHFAGSTKWQFPKWGHPNGEGVDLGEPNSYVRLYQRAVANGTTKPLGEYDSGWNERLVNLMTRGDCGLTALAFGIALSTKGVTVDYLINSAETHGFLSVDRHLVDITGIHEFEVVKDVEEYSEHKRLPMFKFAEYWVPHDLLGWLLLRHWAERYGWDFERNTLVDQSNPNGCMTPPEIHLGGPTLKEIEQLNQAGLCARQLPLLD